MEAANVCLVLVLAVLFGNGLTSNICEDPRCNCIPDNNPTSVECNCNGDSQPLDFTAHDFDDTMNQVSMVNFTNCNKVNFQKDSFKRLKQLGTLVVDKAGIVIFNTGVFESLKKLHLRQIQNLQFKQYAFMGSKGLENIIIDSSSVSQVETHALYDVTDLKSLLFTNTTVNVKKEAVKIHMSNVDSSVMFDNSVIENVEEKGINIITNKFTIKDSVIGNLAPKSTNITSRDYILITHSVVNSTLDGQALNLTAQNVTINSNNFFTRLSMEILANISSNKVSFTNNTVLDVVPGAQLEKLQSTLQQREIRHNRFICTCAFSKSIGILPKPFADNNFCLVKCNVTLSDFEDLVNQKKTCDNGNPKNLDDNAICAYIAEGTRGRVPPHPTPRQEKSYTATTQKPTMTTKPNSATLNLAPTILTIALVTIVLPQL